MANQCLCSSCSVNLSWVDSADKRTTCLRADVNIYTASAIQPRGARDLCNALRCIEPTPGSKGGLAVLVRNSGCINLACVTDVNGLTAIQAEPVLYVPPVADPNIDADKQQCLPGMQALMCVEPTYGPGGGIVREGGMAVLVEKSKSLNLYVTERTLCGAPYKQIVGDVIINDCPDNALSVDTAGSKGLSVIVGKTDCIELTVVEDDAPCSSVPIKVIKANPIICDSPLNALSCTTGGLSVLVDNQTDAGLPSCVQLDVVDTTRGCSPSKAIRASMRFDPSGDNLAECTADGFGVLVGTSDCMEMKVDTSTGKRRLTIKPLLCGAAGNVLTCGPGGMAVLVDNFRADGTPTCVTLSVVDTTRGCSPSKAVIADIRISQTDPAHQGIRCTTDGLEVRFVDSDCIAMSFDATKGGIKAVPIIDADVGNAMYCTPGCNGVGGMGVKFRDRGDCVNSNILFQIVPDECAPTSKRQVVACVKLSPGACNGLKALPDGLYAPPDLYRGEGYVVVKGGTKYTDPGVTKTAKLRITNCDPCRVNTWLVGWQVAAGEAFVTNNQLDLVEVDWSANINGGPAAGQTNYFRMSGFTPAAGGRIGFSGHHQWAAYPMAPGQSMDIDLVIKFRVFGDAELILSDHRISAVMIPGATIGNDPTNKCVYAGEVL
jgi:hypothetical protein